MNITKTYEASDLGRTFNWPREFIIRADGRVAPAVWKYCAADMWLTKVHTEVDADGDIRWVDYEIDSSKGNYVRIFND